MKTCSQCQSSFEVREEDRTFYQRIGVSEPTLCPDCRNQNRLAFRNERKFYKGHCDFCKKAVISLYSDDKPFTVYCSECWWSDRFDPLDYGIDYDSDRSFFDQLYDLSQRVPKPAILNAKSQNSAYTNYSHENQNCYFCVGTMKCQDCYHCYRVIESKNVVDGFDLLQCELCYECIHSQNLYACIFCESCENSSNLILCKDCIGSQDCFGSVNLKNKRFYIFNQPYSEEEYRLKVDALKKDWSSAVRQFEALKKSLPQKANHILNAENCSGDQIKNSKNCYRCFSLNRSEECAYVYNGDQNRFCMDTNFCDSSELLYNSTNLEDNYLGIGLNLVWYCKSAFYLTNCFNSSDAFGCFGLKKHQYCILNKQYSKEAYESLSLQIIEKMKSDEEWGLFYPIEHSPFAYNETVAQDAYPSDKKSVLGRGWKWKDDLNHVPKDIPGSAVTCEQTGRPFIITSQELSFYKKMDLPLPTLHPDERHHRRVAASFSYKLYSKKCVACSNDIQVTRDESLFYCDECYLKEIY